MAYIVFPIQTFDIETVLHATSYEAQIKNITENFNRDTAGKNQHIQELQNEINRLKSMVEKQKRAILQRNSTRYECDELMNDDGFCDAS